eukprot:scaffold2969_cov129-Skeletonema_dohrnii-CCMP3373.AAC.4
MAAFNLLHLMLASSSLKLSVVLLFLSILGIQAASTPSTSFTDIMTRRLSITNPSSSIVHRIRLLGREDRTVSSNNIFVSSSVKRQHEKMMIHHSRSSCSAMAFCNVHTARRIPSVRNYFSHNHHHHSRYHHVVATTATSSTLSSSSLSSDNYYSAASSISKLSTTTQNNDEAFPSWWPVSQSMSKYVTFSEHIAHVIIPDAQSDDEAVDEEISEGMTCGQIIEWVLRAARNRNETEAMVDDVVSDATTTAAISTRNIFNSISEDSDDSYTTLRHKTITDEYQEGQSISTSTKVLDPAYRHDPNSFPQLTHYANNLSSAELLAMGSIWSLPYSASTSSKSSTTTIMDRFDPSNGVKPTRLTMGNYNDTVCSGDYFRVHFNPRRFVDANKYDWSGHDGVIICNGDDGGKPGVIVKRDDETGYLIINKPPNIPVHARVDNLLENVASSVGRMLWLERKEQLLSKGSGDLTSISSDGSDVGNTDEDDVVEFWPSGMRKKKKKNSNQKQKSEKLVYVATPQRLDQNTSGLLVVATKKSFASYFAKLLRTKTSGQLQSGGSSQSSCGVHKSYRCLVCVTPKHDNEASATTSSMAGEVQRLQKFEAEGTIIKHFLEPSIRAPKRFVERVPEDTDNPESWAECLLKITNITNICTVVGNDPSDALATDLWGDFGRPNDCVGILELEIELLTGRTHQIRGQMAALGFPLVGDVQYGGAVPNTSSEYMKNCKGRAEGFLDSETLALQCSTLEFLDPDATDDVDKAQRSDRWLSFHLDGAFWTPFVKQYHAESESLSGAAMTFEGVVSKGDTSEQQTALSTDDQLLPPRVHLSPGSHKYVVIRATKVSNADEEIWFVRSASPEECGGPFHANVAQDLLNCLQSLGYSSTVMGGGRIDFLDNEEVSHAHVFGFSYGFGKGDHEKVANIIEENSDIIATSDMSDGLY